MAQKQRAKELLGQRKTYGVPNKATPVGGEHWVEADEKVLVMQVYCCWGFPPEACNHKGIRTIDCCCFTCLHSMITAYEALDPTKEAFLWKNRGVGTHDSR